MIKKFQNKKKNCYYKFNKLNNNYNNCSKLKNSNIKKKIKLHLQTKSNY